MALEMLHVRWKRAFFGYFLPLLTKSDSPQSKVERSIGGERFFAALRMTERGKRRDDEGIVPCGME